jgi:hypothetical protein
MMGLTGGRHASILRAGTRGIPHRPAGFSFAAKISLLGRQAFRMPATIWTRSPPATCGNPQGRGALIPVSGPFCPHEPDPFQALPSWSAFSLAPPPVRRPHDGRTGASAPGRGSDRAGNRRAARCGPSKGQAPRRPGCWPSLPGCRTCARGAHRGSAARRPRRQGTGSRSRTGSRHRRR